MKIFRHYFEVGPEGKVDYAAFCRPVPPQSCAAPPPEWTPIHVPYRGPNSQLGMMRCRKDSDQECRCYLPRPKACLAGAYFRLGMRLGEAMPKALSLPRSLTLTLTLTLILSLK